MQPDGYHLLTRQDTQNRSPPGEKDVELWSSDGSICAGRWQLLLLVFIDFEAHGFSDLRSALVYQDLELAAPVVEFATPVIDCGAGTHDEVGSAVTRLVQVGQEGDGLHRLAKSHLVSQDGVDSLLVENAQPVQANQLVGLQLTPVWHG